MAEGLLRHDYFLGTRGEAHLGRNVSVAPAHYFYNEDSTQGSRGRSERIDNLYGSRDCAVEAQRYLTSANVIIDTGWYDYDGKVPAVTVVNELSEATRLIATDHYQPGQ